MSFPFPLRSLRRLGRRLEREGLLERDTEQLDLSDALDEDDAIPDLDGHSITYRIAVGPHRGRKVFTLQTLPICNEEGWATGGPGNVAGFSLHAGVAVKACQRDKLKRVCRYICRPPVSEERLFLTARGDIGYTLKTPYHDGTTHVIFEPLDFIARLAALPCWPGDSRSARSPAGGIAFPSDWRRLAGIGRNPARCVLQSVSNVS